MKAEQRDRADRHESTAPCVGPGRQRSFATRIARARLIWLRRKELRWDWLALSVLLGLSAGLLMPPLAAARVPDEIGAGELYLGTDRDRLAAAPRLATHIEIDISGPVARVTLQQTFRNDSSDWVEGIYAFPLPEDAAVDRLELVIGDRRIVGEIRERAAARESYERARSDGRKASLVEQQRPNLFTTSVANVAPGEQITVELGYLQTLALRDGAYRLRFPMTLTPRYSPGPVGQSAHNATPAGTAGATPAYATTAVSYEPPVSAAMASQALTGHRMSLDARLDPGFALARLESLYHQIDTWWDRDRYIVKLRDGDVALDRDFVLVWVPELGAEPEASVFTEEIDGEIYALLLVMPPAAHAPARHAREIVFVIDTSGSMGGPSIAQARDAVLHALDRLAPDDRFNVIQFNSITEQLFSKPVPAHASNLEAARRYVAALGANGGTEMRPALLAGLQDGGGGGVRQLVFVTDGSVGNETALFSLIQQHLGRTRLFTVGIGAAPNTWFMRKTAQYGRGSYTYIGDGAEVAERMRGLFDKLEQPVLSDLDVRWPGGPAAERFPGRLPDLYAGEPLIVTAKLSQLPRRIDVDGNGPGGGWLRQLELDRRGPARGVATLWARAKLEALVDREVAGEDAEKIRAEALTVAMRHRIVSRYTSFVAVEQVASRTAGAELAKRAVPNSLPRGSTMGASIGMPTTATSAPVHAAIGLLMLSLVALGFWQAGRHA